MANALNIAQTGLDAQQTRLSIISNNLANVATTGYKKSRPNFEDLLYETISQPGASCGLRRLNGGARVRCCSPAASTWG